jgi:hypothetical protein
MDRSPSEMSKVFPIASDAASSTGTLSVGGIRSRVQSGKTFADLPAGAGLGDTVIVMPSAPALNAPNLAASEVRARATIHIHP